MTPEQIRQTLRERQQRLIETPITAIYSKTDGVVDEVIAGLEQNQDVLGPLGVHGAKSIPSAL